MRRNKILHSLGAISVFAVLAPSVYASGFQVFETNASGLGNAFAGAAAESADAASEFDNPASIVRLKNPELDASGVVVMSHGNFYVDSIQFPVPGGKNPVNPLGTSVLPAIHFTSPITERLFFGFGTTVPFGYFTDYGESSLSSNYSAKSQIEAININPSLAYKITEKLSFGLGFDAQYLKAVYNRTVKSFPIPIAPNTTFAINARLLNSCDDWGYGWNAGLLYQFDPCTRVGLSYRSLVRHSPSGDAKLQGSATLATPKGSLVIPIPLFWDLNTNIDLPEMVLLSGYHDFNEKIAGMATVEYTHWSRFSDLPMRLTNGIVNSTITIHEGFHNTFRCALGGNYRFNEHWMWRVGAAYDQSPVDDDNRTTPLPDGNRVWLSTGLQYIFNHYVTADIGYAHLFIESGKVNNIDPLSGHIVGHYDNNYANLLGCQLSVKFN